MKNFSTQCFVCQEEIDSKTAHKNQALNLPVCEKCKGTKAEEVKEKELTEGLADGFVCGCI